MEKDFWIVLVSTAATLAGFTLASYSIFAARIEVAAADPICRRFAFRDCTSEYSLAFMHFALNMLVVPLVAGIVVLFPSRTFDDSWHLPIGLGVLVLEGFLLYAVARITRKQFKYEEMYSSYAKALRVKTMTGPPRMLDTMRLVVAMTMLGVSWLIFLVNLWHLSARLARTGVTLLHFDLLKWLADGLPAALAAAISLFLGLALVSWYFFLFEPSRLLFKADDATDSILDETRKNIEASLDRIDRVQKWLQERVANAKVYLDVVAFEPPNDEAKLAKALLVEAEEYLKGVTSGVKHGDQRLEDRAPYHYGWLQFCRDRTVIPFREIIRIIHGIDLYTQAVINYEQRLKEMPQQLAILIDPLVPVRKRVERGSAF